MSRIKPIKEALEKLPKNGNGQSAEPDAQAVAESVKAAIEAAREEPNPFPLDAMPKAIQEIVSHWHQVYRRPTDFHGSSIIAAASAAIGNAFHVEHVAGSVQPLAVWTVIVGPPSSAKSPIMRTCMRPLFDKEDAHRKNLDDDLAQWELDKAAAAQSKAREPARPQLEQRIVSDATIESLIKVLMQSKCWKGVIAFKDEFMGLIKGMNAYKTSGQDLEHFLSMWSGMPIMLNRSGMEFAGYVKAPFVAVLGAIQPGILNGLTDGGKIANGFLYRLLFAFPESVKIPLPSGELPRKEVYERYARIIARLNDLPGSGDRTPTVLRMNAPAFKAYERHKTHIEQEIINKTDDENIQSLYGKMVDYTLRLAAILDLLEFVSEAEEGFLKMLSHADMARHTIGAASVHRAIKLSEYFTRNSIRILTRTEDPVAALPVKQFHLYEKLPHTCTSGFAVEVAAKLGVSEKTARRLVRNRQLFAQNKDGSYRKLYT